MTITNIPDDTRRRDYTLTGGETELPVPFPFYAAADIQVLRRRAGVLATLIEPVDYTLSGVGLQPGGSVLLAAPALAGDSITVRGIQPLARTTSFQDGGALPARSINDEFNRLVIAQQQLAQGLRQTLRVPADEPTIEALPAVSARAGKVAAYDEQGRPIAADPVASSIMQSPTSLEAFAEEVAALLSLRPSIEIGTVLAYTGTLAPTGYLMCFGQVVNIADHQQLYDRIGTTYNTGGESVLQFRLPDYRGRTLIGRDNMGGFAAGRVTVEGSGIAGGTLGAVGGDQLLQQHAHTAAAGAHDHSTTISSAGAHTHTSSGGTVNIPRIDGVGEETFIWGLTFGAIGPGEPANSTFEISGGATSEAGSHTHTATTAPSSSTVTVAPSGAGFSANVQPSAVVNWIIYRGGGELNEGVVPPHGHNIEDIAGLVEALGTLTAEVLFTIGAERVADFTLALADASFIPVGAAGAIVVTVPANATEAFPIGTQKTIKRTSTGAVSIAAAGGVTIVRPAGTDASARDTGSTLTLIKVGTDAWTLAGDLTPTTAAAAAGAVTSSGLTMATARILGRTTGSSGAVEEITVGSGLTLSAGTLAAAATGGAASITKCVRGTNFALTAFSWTVVGWDQDIFDDLGAHSTTTNTSRIVVPAGITRARFTAYAVYNNSSSGTRVVVLDKNSAGTMGAGTSIAMVTRAALNESGQTLDSGWIEVAENDHFEIFVTTNTAGISLIGPSGSFGGRAYFQAEFLP
jgi:microcystin-dependent protein